MRICLVGNNGSSLLGKFSGGSEKQIALMARSLAKRGHQVTLVTTQDPYLDACVDGVFLRRAWDPKRGLPKVRFITYRLPALRRLLGEVSADLYYSRGLSNITPTIVNVARSMGAHSVVNLVNDKDLDSSSGKAFFAIGNTRLSGLVGPAIHRYFQRFVFPHVGCFLAQNKEQAEACRKKGLPFQLIPSIVEPPSQELIGLVEDFDAAWVGNITSDERRNKGLGKLVELIRLLPNAKFVVIGQLTSGIIQPLVDELKHNPNIAVMGPLSNIETLKIIAHSRIVINTSPSEGFSNVMLEAWSLGKPTVTLSVNPNNLLHPGGLGFCAHGDILQMAEVLGCLLANQEERRTMGAKCRSYVEISHSPDSVCELFEKVAVLKLIYR